MYAHSHPAAAPMGTIFDQLGRAGTVHVLLALRDRRAMSFADVKKLLGNPTTATRRLRELQRASLVSRKVLQDRLRTVEYRLTDKGGQVADLADKLRAFG